MQKILLLDLDGTIRQPKSGEKFISSPDDQQPIPGAIEAINYYFDKDWVVIGATNQGGVASGYKSLDNCILEQINTLEIFSQLQGIYFCPNYSGDSCYFVDGVTHNYRTIKSWQPEINFRKPGSGMLLKAMIDFNGNSENTLMIGDRTDDKEAAEAANVDFLWAEAWRQEYQTKIS